MFPEIEINKNLLLQELEAKYADDFFTYLKNPAVNKHILAPIPEDIIEAKYEIAYYKNLFYQKTGIYWGIIETSFQKNSSKKNISFLEEELQTSPQEADSIEEKLSKLIGSIGFNKINFNNKRAEISYDLNIEYWRQNIASLALEKVINYAFTELKLNRIEATTTIKNIPSQKFLEKNHFKKDGILREYRLHKGEFYDMITYSILKNDFRKTNRSS